MKRPVVLAHKFVKAIPNDLEERILYVSVGYATVVHKCCCGCGREIVTPLSPTDWKLTYDGVSISLHPSIGNWGLECQSHYWIERSTITWARQLSRERIEAGRAHDRRAKKMYYLGVGTGSKKESTSTNDESRKGMWAWLSKLWPKRSR